MIEKAINTLMENDAGIGALAGNRIYPVILPQNATQPCITYQRDGSERSSTFNSGQIDFVGATFQIDAWGESYSAARTLGDAIRSALMNYSGTVASVAINNIRMIADLDQYEDEPKLYRHSMSFIVWHTET